jgi:hypothetical protein
MSGKQFCWNWMKVHRTVPHLADQCRWNNAFSRQDKDAAFLRDVTYLNEQPEFCVMDVTRRHLHGKEGLYCRVYGTAATLRAQLSQHGREVAMNQFTPKCFGISTVSMLRDHFEHFENTKSDTFDLLIDIANNRAETTSNSSQMTRFEKGNYDKEAGGKKSLNARSIEQGLLVKSLRLLSTS